MRPVSLTIEGLTSFRHPQHVEFEDFNLFVITGPTGSGKTSIFDAMTFALFGKVCRVKADDLRDLITHNHPFLRVEFVFEVQGQRYRVTRRAVRRKVKDDAPQRILKEAVLERVVAEGDFIETEIPGVRQIDSRIEEILGLDFDTFTKAVLLPQGKFHEFLSGDVETRRRVLTGLLDLGRYSEAGMMARGRARDLAVRIDERHRLLADRLARATPANLAAASTLADEASKRAEQMASGERQVRLISRRRAISIERIALMVRSAEPLDRIVAELDLLEASAGQLVEDEIKHAASVRQLEGRVSELEAQSLACRQDLTDAIQRFGDESECSRLLQAAETVESEDRKLRDVDLALNALHDELASAQALLTEARSASAEVASNLVMMDSSIERLREAQVVADATERLATLEERLQDADKEAEAANTRLADASNARQRCQLALDHLLTVHSAGALRVSLAVGTQCPVCEHIVDRIPIVDPTVDGQITKAKSKLREAESAHSEAQTDASRRYAERGTVAHERDRLLSSLPKFKHVPSSDEARKRGSDLRAQAVVLHERYIELKSTERRTMETATELTRTVASLSERFQAREREKGDLEARIREASLRLADKFPNQPLHITKLSLMEQVETLRSLGMKQIETLDKAEQARSALAVARETLILTISQGEQIKSRLHQFSGTVQEASRALGEEDLSSTATLVPAVSDVGIADHIQHVRRICRNVGGRVSKQCAQAVAEVEGLEDSLKQLISSFGIDVSSIEDVENLIDVETRQAERRRDMLNRDVEELARMVDERREIENTIQSDQKAKLLSERLAQELRSDRFISFVLTESMRNLASLATVELKHITGDRYSIEAKDSGFEVIDHDNADERRTVSTLSGGETFLASLALALALSGSIRDLAGNAAAARLDSMFIDEGFGALDAETLDIAVDALERLIGTNRMVGVISHVPALAERIPAGLNVQRVGASSTIARR